MLLLLRTEHSSDVYRSLSNNLLPSTKSEIGRSGSKNGANLMITWGIVKIFPFKYLRSTYLTHSPHRIPSVHVNLATPTLKIYIQGS